MCIYMCMHFSMFTLALPPSSPSFCDGFAILWLTFQIGVRDVQYFHTQTHSMLQRVAVCCSVMCSLLSCLSQFKQASCSVFQYTNTLSSSLRVSLCLSRSLSISLCLSRSLALSLSLSLALSLSPSSLVLSCVLSLFLSHTLTHTHTHTHTHIDASTCVLSLPHSFCHSVLLQTQPHTNTLSLCLFFSISLSLCISSCFCVNTCFYK